MIPIGFKPTFDLSSAGILASAESQRALVTLEKGLPPGATDPTDVFLHSSSGPLPASSLTSYGTALKSLHGAARSGRRSSARTTGPWTTR